jgi:hypothetical protein
MSTLHEDAIAKGLTGIVGVPWSMAYEYVDTYKLPSLLLYAAF